jgi:prepilin peptidase CpaA
MGLGAWTGAGGPRGAFLLGEQAGGWLGALDGLLFALAGFAVGFGLFVVMFVLGTCRGGDVKLFAAVGAWVGPVLAVYLLAGTIVFVVLLAVLRLVWQALARGLRPTVRDYTLAGTARKGKRGAAADPATRKRLMAYSPAVALSAGLVLLWFWRVDLHLAPPKAEDATRTQANARP